ncbi:uncharacterized protein LOC123309718 [Coccinella septempunctata]|uniref:uncharacterized protein LOC123309718 n=1 Tax=Coccinella septempunctata TaxID=41139 RepID=UPI001D08AF7D|nr:uncharacterized protein LOC123309718 [Coccinella septempunctata]
MNELMKLSPGKRENALKKLKKERNDRMRAQLPVLNREEVIRYRLPPHEALLRAIGQDGYKNTAEYMKQLIDYQEYVRNFYGPDTNVWLRPRLKYNMDILYHLRDGLATAEKAHLADNIANEVREILKLAVEYAFGEEDWWWLGHQLLDQSITISRDFKRDAGMYHSIARYALGKFLLEKITDVDAALEHLNIARSISVGNPWSAKGIFKTHQKTVFTEVSILLYKVILKQARQCMKYDPHLAIKLCKTARKAALDGCHYSGETEAYITEGECEQLIHDTQSAIKSFQKALAIQSFHEDPHWKCEAMSHLAIAYLKHGLLSSALQMLHDLKDYAVKHQLTFYVAQSYKYLGEYYLREGTPQNATPLLKIALRLFNEGNYIHEAESARNYAAISIGIELINPYIELVVACDEKNPDYDILMRKLIEWKDSRVTFWKDLKGEISFGRIDEANRETESDFLRLTESNAEMPNREVVLSVKSLVGSKDSFRVGERVASKSRESVEESTKESREVESVDEEAFVAKKVDSKKGSTDDEKKEVITLHVTENFTDD